MVVVDMVVVVSMKVVDISGGVAVERPGPPEPPEPPAPSPRWGARACRDDASLSAAS